MSDWTEKIVPISQVKDLLDNGYEIEVDSPDGWVEVSDFINKGFWDEYVLDIPEMTSVRCNADHLFETSLGWYSAHSLLGREAIFLTHKGMKVGNVRKTDRMIPIVDIQVEHENHRYYTEGISSHNTGAGKSLFMCHCAAANLSMGKNVLYITMELAEEEVAKRIDANLLNTSFDDLMVMPKDMYHKRVAALKAKTTGKLIIKEYPTAAASTLHFKTLLNELYLKKSFKPDIIYVDYLNICCSARVKPGANINSYTYIKSIAEELRGLAVEFEVPLVSATQTNRTGFDSSDVDLTNTSESFGLPATADFMFALITSEELEQLGQIQVKQLKNRFADPSQNKRFLLGIDKSKMKLFDLEDSAQKDITDSGQDRPVMDHKSKFKSLKV